MCGGNAFQRRGPHTLKQRSPKAEKVRGTISKLESVDRIEREETG